MIPDRFKEFTGVSVGVKRFEEYFVVFFLSKWRCAPKAFFADLYAILEGFSGFQGLPALTQER